MYIIGASGFGREVLAWANDIPQTQRDWEPVGFLDDDPEALRAAPTYLKVVGSVWDFSFEANALAVIAIGKPSLKKRIAEHCQGKVQFATIIHPRAVVGPYCHVGQGCILCPYSVLTTNVVVGDHVLVNLAASLGHDVRIGDFCTINCHADVTGNVVLEEGVYLSSHVSILPSARVEAFAYVGAGSIVLRRVRAGTVVFGAPTKKIGDVKS